MKKILLIILSVIAFYSLENVSAATFDFKKDIDVFIEEYSEVEFSWEGAMSKHDQKLYGNGNEHVGQLFRVFQDDIQQGYIVYLFKDGIVEAKFKGSDKAKEISGKVYYQFPSRFVSKQEFHNRQMSDENIAGSTGYGYSADVTAFDSVTGTPTNVDYPIYDTYDTASNVVSLNSNYRSYSTSMSGKFWIDYVPDYLNEIMSNGCAPVASTMLVAYYDNQIWNDLSDEDGSGSFPLSAEDDSTWYGYSDHNVYSLAWDLSDAMHTCYDGACSGTYLSFLLSGLNDYFDDHNHEAYHAVYANIKGTTATNEIADYTSLIMKGNPVLLWLSQEEYGGIDHVVLGVGFYTAYRSPMGFIIHDNLSHGQTWISQTYVDGMIFMYSGSPTSTE